MARSGRVDAIQCLTEALLPLAQVQTSCFWGSALTAGYRRKCSLSQGKRGCHFDFRTELNIRSDRRRKSTLQPPARNHSDHNDPLLEPLLNRHDKFVTKSERGKMGGRRARREAKSQLPPRTVRVTLDYSSCRGRKALQRSLVILALRSRGALEHQTEDGDNCLS